MMEPKIFDIYVDSCCFIALAKCNINNLNDISEVDFKALITLLNSRGKHTIKDKDNKERTTHIVNIFTSMLTIAECTHANESTHQEKEETRRLFKSILESGKVVKLISPTLGIIANARDLRWEHEINIHGAMDSIHVASAINHKCSELITLDKKMLSSSGDDNEKIYNMFGLKIVAPSEIGLLNITSHDIFPEPLDMYSPGHKGDKLGIIRDDK